MTNGIENGFYLVRDDEKDPAILLEVKDNTVRVIATAYSGLDQIAIERVEQGKVNEIKNTIDDYLLNRAQYIFEHLRNGNRTPHQ